MASLSDYFLELFPEKPSKQARQMASDTQFLQQTPPQEQPAGGPGTVSVLSMEPTPAQPQQQTAPMSFPFDEFAGKAAKAQDARRMLTSQINSIVLSAPKDMRDDLRKSLESEIDFIPKETPSTNEFLAKNPILLESGKELSKLAERRSKTTSDARSIVNLIDSTFASMPKNPSKQKEYLANFARELSSQGKAYNEMVSGNPDALSEGEAQRVLPSLKSSWFNVKGMLESGQDVFLGEQGFKKGIELYKKQVQDMHDVMIRRSISDYNNYAKRTSPEIADTIGFNADKLKAYNPAMQMQVISRKNPVGSSREDLIREAERRGLLKTK
jgi:hypothetical protein